MADEQKVPPTVPEIVRKLAELGRIKTITVEYRQSGVDSADTYLTLIGFDRGDGKPAPQLTALREDVARHLDIQLDYCSIASLKAKDYEAYKARAESEAAACKRTGRIPAAQTEI